MKRLLQIDSCLNMLSTGRITESIGNVAKDNGWDVYIVHGARYARPGSCMHSIQAETRIGEYLHYAEGLFFDNHGLASRRATNRVIEQIRKIKPDVVQLHCIHGYYINYRLLFEYLNTTTIPIVWTFHDCWAFTGHCPHFVTQNCFKWREEGCHDCPKKGNYPKSFVDFSSRNFNLKKKLFGGCEKLHIVAVSEWLASYTKQSFLKDKDIRVINNGVDINVFHPFPKEKQDMFKIIGVASAWSKGKGLYDFFSLRERLPSDSYEITLVGLTPSQLSELPKGIIGMERTNSVADLAKLYSSADVFVNPTYGDSFPTVNMEALACGTPVITYKTGGSPEIIDKGTGIVVTQGDVDALVDAIKKNKKAPLSSEACRLRAVDKYDKDKRFTDYINLYNEILKQ